MPIYISRGKFTSDAVKGMLAKPENREEVVANLYKSVGGKLIGWYLTFGRHDWLVIGEFPDEKAVASAILAGAAGGSLSDIETTVAMNANVAVATFEAAGKAAKGFGAAYGIWSDPTLVDALRTVGIEPRLPSFQLSRRYPLQRMHSRLIPQSAHQGGVSLDASKLNERSIHARHAHYHSTVRGFPSPRSGLLGVARLQR